MERKALDLLTSKRFDILAKYMYAYFRENNINCGFGTEVYKEHLRVWNNFKEYNNPDKTTFDDFKRVFNTLLDDIKSNGFNHEFPVPVDHKTGDLMNGAHRLTSCLLYNKPIHVTDSNNKRDGMIDCQYDMFKSLGLDEPYMDAMAIEYIKLKPNTYIVTLFPAGRGRREEAMELIKTEGNIVYHKTTNISFEGSVNLMRLFYGEESWAGNWGNDFQGCRGKSEVCYKDSSYNDIDGDTTFILVEFPTLESSVRCKQKVRTMYNIGNHSIHINDTYDETIKIGKTVFNNNGINFLNKSKRVLFNTFNTCLTNYKKYIKDNNLNPDDYCITASSVLSVYGLRECKDLDYLHFTNKQIGGHHLIHTHNTEISQYTMDKDTILFDPRNYFYYDNVKFAAPHVIDSLKKKRGEDKDIVDVELLSSVL